MSLTLKNAEKSDLANIELIKDTLQKNDLPYQDINADNIELFLANNNSDFVGIVGLEKFDDVALLRSMVVKEKFRGQGYGRKICTQILKIAQKYNIKEVFLLTCTAKDFFEHLGFKKINRDNAPETIKSTIEFSSLCPASAICMKINL